MAESDEVLLERARTGDRDAFGVLVDRYRLDVAAAVAAMLGRTPDVDDTVQETMIRFYDTMEQFRGEASLRTYLHRIAVNLALDRLRARRRWHRRFIAQDETPPGFEPAAEAEEPDSFDRDRAIQRALDQLSPEHRAVVVHRVMNGYSTKQTAEMLDLPYGTVLSRLSRALDRMKPFLSPDLLET